MNRETKRGDFKPIKSCTLARDRSTLIIYAEKDDDFCKIVLDSVKKIKSLKDLVEIEFSAEKKRTIIILVIPVYYEPDVVLVKLAQDLGTEEHLEGNKIIRRETSKTYQMVVELEDIQAIQLVREKTAV